MKQKTISRAISVLLHLVIFLLPLFFIPATFDFYEFNKQILLLILVGAAMLLWLGKSIFIKKTFTLAKTPLDLFLLIFLAAVLLATLFAVDKDAAFWGFYGRFAGSFLTLASFLALVFLIINHRTRSLRLGNLLKTFLWSGAALLWLSILSLLGFWAQFSWLPRLVRGGLFTPTGSFAGLAVFLACFSGLLLAIFYFGHAQLKKGVNSFVYTKIFLLGNLCLAVALLFCLQSARAWFVLLAFLFLLIPFLIFRQTVRNKTAPKITWQVPFLAVFVFVFGALALFAFTDLGQKQPPQEVLPTAKTTLEIAWAQLKKDPLLGVGPGSYFYAFAQSRPVSFNQGNFWQLRFDRAGSHFLETIAHVGILGFGAYLFLLAALFFVCFKAALAFYPRKNFFYLVPVFATAAFLLAQLVYWQNITLGFSFWFFVALTLLALKKSAVQKAFGVRRFIFKQKPEWGALLAGIFLMLVILGGWGLFGAGRFYLADIRYAQASNQAKGLAARLSAANQATGLNPHIPDYQVLLAQLYLAQAKDFIAQETLNSEQQSEKLRAILDRAITAGKRATDLASQNPAFWENLGGLYREMAGLVSGAHLWSQEAFKKAFALDPQNPRPAVLAAQAYLAEVASNEFARDTRQLQEAERFLTAALQLKPDYEQARIYLAVVRETQEKTTQAEDILLAVIAQNPQSTEAYFQLGRIYFNRNQITWAIEQFKKVLEINPNHANALYSLGTTYRVLGQNQLALEQFQKVLILNPGNKDVAGKIRELKGEN